MKLFIFLLAATFVAGSPSARGECRDPEDNFKCGNRCKFLGFNAWVCDELMGCKCYTDPEISEEIPDDEQDFKCLSKFDNQCESYCKRKGFDLYGCDVENTCNCYGQPMPHYASYEDIQPLAELEEIQPFGGNYEVTKPSGGFQAGNEQIQCFSEKDYARCREFCKRKGFSDAICKKDSECQCFAPYEPLHGIKSEVRPQQKCYPGLDRDMTCNRYCESFGSKSGICESNGQCRCLDRDLSPYF